jgi:cytochrome c biogenesis protein CcmG, thiol:disulfide interchange protein DsbE
VRRNLGNHPVFPKRAYLLAAVATVATAVVIAVIVQTLHSSAAVSTGAGVDSGLGFLSKDMKPVPFSLPVLAGDRGRDVSMSSLIGKPVVLNLWAHTCSVCTTETPAVEAVARRVGSQVEFVGIDTLDTRGAALAFLHRYDVSYLQLFDSNGTVANSYGVPGLPVTFFISASGTVLGENVGALTQATLTHYLAKLFGVSSTASIK